MKTIQGIEGFKAMAGQELGESDWHQVTQDQIDKFADATGDHQWIHVDQERAKAGPFGTTIAHGFLTLSLLPSLTGQVTRAEGIRMAINYGLNRVRFPAPVRSGDSVHARIVISGAETTGDAVQVATSVTIEVEGQAKPACVAEMLSRYYP